MQCKCKRNVNAMQISFAMKCKCNAMKCKGNAMKCKVMQRNLMKI